jgi:hypothetical protein
LYFIYFLLLHVFVFHFAVFDADDGRVRGISTSGFFDKDDFVRALQAAPRAAPPAPPSQTSHLTPVAASNLSTAEPPRPFANMPVDNPDSQIQVNENPSPDVVARGLNTLMAQPYIMIKVVTIRGCFPVFPVIISHHLFSFPQRRMEMLNFMIGFEQNNQYPPPLPLPPCAHQVAASP